MSKKHNIAKEERLEEANYRKYEQSLVDDSDIDWADANIEGVLIDGKPLDGHYVDHVMDSIER